MLTAAADAAVDNEVAGVISQNMEKTHRASRTTAAADKKVRPQVPFDLYAFPFENVVFEGGSGNVLAFVGAVRVSTVHLGVIYICLRRTDDKMRCERERRAQ